MPTSGSVGALSPGAHSCWVWTLTPRPPPSPHPRAFQDFIKFATESVKGEKKLKWGKAKKGRFRDFVTKMSSQMFDVIHGNVTVRGRSWDEVSKDNDHSPKDPELKKELLATQQEVIDMIDRVVEYRRTATPKIQDAIAAAAAAAATAATAGPSADQPVPADSAAVAAAAGSVGAERADQLEMVLKALQSLGKSSQAVSAGYKGLDDAARTQLAIATSQLEALLSRPAAAAAAAAATATITTVPAAVTAPDDGAAAAAPPPTAPTPTATQRATLSPAGNPTAGNPTAPAGLAAVTGGGQDPPPADDSAPITTKGEVPVTLASASASAAKATATATAADEAVGIGAFAPGSNMARTPAKRKPPSQDPEDAIPAAGVTGDLDSTFTLDSAEETLTLPSAG